MTKSRKMKLLATFALCVAAVAVPPAAVAQGYPAKTVRIIIP